MNHITSPNEPFPRPSMPDSFAAATKTHTQGNFRIATRKLPISKAGPIDEMQDRLGIPVPEMIFGDNLVAVTHVPTGWSIRFDAFDALDCVDKTDKKMLQVAYAKDWSSTRENTSAGVKDVVKPYDWSYSTEYAGTLDVPGGKEGGRKTIGMAEVNGEAAGTEAAAAGAGAGEQAPTTAATTATAGDEPTSDAEKKFDLKPSKEEIPLELLKRRDPILFFDEVVLYESELDDNGISLYSAKLRVHEERMLLLCRLFMRLDNVVVRVRDTRVYVDFKNDVVLREYTAKEDTFENVKRGLFMSGRLPDDITASLRDANLLSTVLPTVESKVEEIRLKDL